MATQPRPEPAQPYEAVGGLPVAAEAWGVHGQWGAITAGALAGLAAFMLVAVLGLAIGITAGDPLSAEAAGIAAGIWWIITLLATGIFGGWVTGRTARQDRAYMPVIYGTVTWILGILITMLLLTLGVGNIIGGVGGAVGQAMSGRPMPSTSQIDIGGIATSTAWVLFASLIIGLAATILGAWLGSPQRRMRRRGPQLA